MQIVILLTLVILLGFFLKKEKSQYARMVIGSIFGIIFFSIWPFIVFSLEIHELSNSYHAISYITVSLLAALIVLLLLRLKHKQIVTILSFFLFIITTIISISFESKIKNKISIYTGYFADKNIAQKNSKSLNTSGARNVFAAHNYFFSLNKQWTKKSDKGPLFQYFQWVNEENKISEFRPRCFSSEEISLPEIVHNLNYFITTDNMTMDKTCYKMSNYTYSCKISSLNQNNKAKRTRWYLMDSRYTYGAELDFVLFEDSQNLDAEIEKIINSIKLNKNTSKDIDCLVLAEWL